MSEPLIRYKNVCVCQQGLEILNDINFELNQGEFVYFVGKVGSGKTSLLKTVYGELDIQSGEAEVMGFDLRTIKQKHIPDLRRQLGIVFQDFRLIPNMTVYDNVAFAMRVVGAREKAIRKRVPYVINIVGLSQKARCYPNELSGGEQQRVALARALVNNADIIIADEPTGNVDPQMSLEIVELLKRLNETGTTVIMVTHEHSLVKCFDKRVITIEKGSVASDVPCFIGEAATAHINAASEISNEYVVPPDEDYSAYVSRSDVPAPETEEAEDSAPAEATEGGEN